MLTRDCEVLHAVVCDVPELFKGSEVRQVFASRAALYPIRALNHPKEYSRWAFSEANQVVLRNGRAAKAYLRAQLTPKSRRVLVVDTGWRGRLQTLIEEALGGAVSVHGYYFALRPDAEESTTGSASILVPWRWVEGREHVVEALMGSRGRPLDHFTMTPNGSTTTVFRPGSDDVSPQEYRDMLEAGLSARLRLWEGNAAKRPLAPRARTTRQVLSSLWFPDKRTSTLFAESSLATWVNGSDTRAVVPRPLSKGGIHAILRQKAPAWTSAMCWNGEAPSLTARFHQVLLFLVEQRGRCVRERWW